jgi:fumarylacetoacetase
MTLNHTHDPAARSWVASANGHADFPIQNMPYAVFAETDGHPRWRGGVAIGDQVLDLPALHAAKLLTGAAAAALEAASLSAQTASLNALMATGPEIWQALRHALFALLRDDAPAATQATVQKCLVPQAGARYRVPSQVANYTDFYTSIHHARNVGRIARPDADPLTANFQWLPIAYHGRASSVVISGTPFHRPMGQAMPPGAKAPLYGPLARGWTTSWNWASYIGHGQCAWASRYRWPRPKTTSLACACSTTGRRATPVLGDGAARPLPGQEFLHQCVALDRDVTEALAPFRVPPFTATGPEPQPLAYLDDSRQPLARRRRRRSLTVGIESTQQCAQGLAASEISRTSFRHQYWTVAQMVTQHTVGGCNLQSGDLLGTGTISGPTPEEAGAIIELTQGGKVPMPLARPPASSAPSCRTATRGPARLVRKARRRAHWLWRVPGRSAAGGGVRARRLDFCHEHHQHFDA